MYIYIYIYITLWLSPLASWPLGPQPSLGP